MCPNLPYLSVEVEQFVFQEVGVGGHEWPRRGGGDRRDSDPGQGEAVENYQLMPRPQQGSGEGRC